MKILRELKCRLGWHRLVTYIQGCERSWAECYQSDHCRGRAHKVEGGAA